MPTPTLVRQATAQAVYMEYLLNVAKRTVSSGGELPLFDPQGRFLTDVHLSDDQYAEIVHSIIRTLGDEFEGNFSPNKVGLDSALGMVTTPTTTVSVDISKGVEKELFQAQLVGALNKNAIDKGRKPDEGANAKVLVAVANVPKGSIIALQQEFHCHLGLSSRVYQSIILKQGKKDEGQLQTEITAAHQAAMQRVNELVMASYAKALKSAIQKDGTLDLAKLNATLDKERKSITPKAQTILMQEMIRNTGVMLTKEELKSAKKLAEETTASPNDVLHTDNGLGVATLIEGSDATAHHREAGPHSAHRQLITHSVSDEGVVTANKNPRIQIRVPSLALKSSKLMDKLMGVINPGFVDDVAVKLGGIKTEYHLSDRLTGGAAGGKPKAFVYNLFTASNSGFGDEYKNLQTESARHILLGAHQYNMQQLERPESERVLCFVQNISVNGFGDTLSYGTNNPLREETTLMAAMALLHTLYDALPPYQDAIRSVMNQYQQYLKQSKPDGLPYFSQTQQGMEAIEAIKTIKSAWVSAASVPDSKAALEDVLGNAKHSLKNLMANNRHFTHEDAKLFQSLSVFVEEASIGGCKSANERAQTINGRVAMLDAVLNSPDYKLTEDGENIRQALAQLARATSETVKEKAEALRIAVDTAYNKIGLQGAASVVSLLDQGASAKVEAKPWYFKILPKLFLSTNYGEESEQVMTNMSQSKAGKMQAHKDLPDSMKNAWEGHPTSWWDRMCSSPLKKIGALLGTLIFPVALIVAGVGAYQNKQVKAATEAANTALLRQYAATGNMGTHVASSDMTMFKGLNVDPRHAQDMLAHHAVDPTVEDVEQERLVTSQPTTPAVVVGEQDELPPTLDTGMH